MAQEIKRRCSTLLRHNWKPYTVHFCNFLFLIPKQSQPYICTQSYNGAIVDTDGREFFILYRYFVYRTESICSLAQGNASSSMAQTQVADISSSSLSLFSVAVFSAVKILQLLIFNQNNNGRINYKLPIWRVKNCVEL